MAFKFGSRVRRFTGPGGETFEVDFPTGKPFRPIERAPVDPDPPLLTDSELVFQFVRDTTHLRRVFPPRGPRGIVNSYTDILGFTVDALGTSRFAETLGFSTTAGVGVPSVTLIGPAGNQLVPSGSLWFVFACSALHNDPVARSTWIRVDYPSAGALISVAVSVPQSVAQLIPVASPRPLVLRPGSQLGAECLNIAAAQTVAVNALVVEVPIGEVVRY